ncbi:MAG: bifunctional UDP-sugar hydrolase/5'-nucleotidase [Actinomyces sp.]|uniref:bifunctional metallophosphatase/5'-nucleotidase n=1 Tax=Actinomyces sp. TaxID=29317 RepID=UPI0026DDABE8|nr:bifunctional UDP-sugar hydrolase/5'-nucleotidase [Actinomyces sp.]MDO4244117.1 bifunctional UDP-sugar hydrolase/5'-nucleotidase [Actinomyces sp.]
MRRNPPLTAITTLAVIVLSVLAPLTAPPAVAEPTTPTISLLGVTDFHGHLERTTNSEGAVVDPGAVTLACEVAAARSADPDTLFVSSGDNVGGSAYTSAILEDSPTLAALNAMGLDVSAVGNHELDRGMTDLTGRIIPASDFPFLAANITGDPTLSAEGDADGAFIKEVDGVRVGFVGVVTDELPTLVSASALEGMEVSEAVSTANARASALKDGDDSNGEADVVVVLSHEDAAAQAGLYTGDVDAVLGGHTHVPFAQTGTSSDGQPIAMVQADHYGRALGRVQLSYDAATGEVAVVSATTQDLTASTCTTDAYGVEEIVTRATAEAQVAGEQVVASLATDFLRGTYAEDGAVQGTGSNRGTESTASNVIADSFAWWVQSNTGAPAGRYIGIMNPGGVRADYAAGELTQGEAFTVQPFGNELGYATYTGAQLRSILAQQWQPGSSRPVLTLGLSGNVEVYVDQGAADLLEGYTKDTPAAEVEAARARVIEAVYVDDALLADEDTVVVASNSFLLSGGDGFSGFTAAAPVNTGMMDLGATSAYLAQGGPVSADYAKRQIGLGVSVDQAAGTATVGLTGLVFTNAAEQTAAGAAASVSATVTMADGTVRELASSSVDTALVTSQLPETGRATLTFALPADVATQPCTVEDPVAGATEAACALVSLTVVNHDGSTELLDIQAQIAQVTGPAPTAAAGATATTAMHRPTVVVAAPSPEPFEEYSAAALVRTGASIGPGLLAVALLVGGVILMLRRRGAPAEPAAGSQETTVSGEADGTVSSTDSEA